MSAINRKILIGLVLLSLVSGFAGGIWFTQQNNFASVGILNKFIAKQVPVEKPEGVDFDLFWQVWQKMTEKYVEKDKLDSKKMLYGAINGMVDSAGDPYTVFFEPPEAKKFQEEISGSFGGVGIEVGMRNDILTVIAPLKDTPAYNAGIQAGDKIIKIDGKTTTEMRVEEAVSLIRGKQGTKVVLTISRNGNGKTIDYELTRDKIKVPTVEWKMVTKNGVNIAYVQVYSFNELVNSEFKRTAQEVLKSNATAMIVDLRNNPGGLLDSAVELAGWFMDKDQLVTTQDFGNGMKNEFKTDGNGALKSLKTVVLINGGSASASEILAGALHDDRKIKLIGEKSFGKGSVQELAEFSDGSSLKVTVAKWLTPAGISISKNGLDPDIKVEIKPDEVASGSIELKQPGKDPQLDKAIDILGGK
jgi:carboxyl-terminal processing protease